MTITIPLNHGLSALVDDEDGHLAAHRWHVRICPNGQKYAARAVVISPRPNPKTKGLLLHREVLGLKPGDPIVDHRNGDGLDCRRANLRRSNRVLNNRNIEGARKHSLTGILGVSPTASGKYKARIQVEGRQIDLGVFSMIEEANAARLAAEVRLWGIEPRRAAAHGVFS